MALDFGTVTLSELLAAADKVRSALDTLRAARAMMGESTAPQATPSPPPAALEDPERQKAIDEWRNSPARAKLLEQFKGGST